MKRPAVFVAACDSAADIKVIRNKKEVIETMETKKRSCFLDRSLFIKMDKDHLFIDIR